MRGVASQGMMISAEELALPGDWFEDGIMQLEAGCALGVDVVELFGLDTAVLDVEITTNRPDAMSIAGLARELAASYGTELRLPEFVNPGRDAEPPGEEPAVSIESGDCYRFVAQRIDGVRVAPAPAWMRVRLALCGPAPDQQPRRRFELRHARNRPAAAFLRRASDPWRAFDRPQRPRRREDRHARRRHANAFPARRSLLPTTNGRSVLRD